MLGASVRIVTVRPQDMPYSPAYCLYMPAEFPDAEVTQFMAIARRVLLTPNIAPVWAEFGGATNLIGWRFRAATESWQFHKASIASYSNPTHEELFHRERAIFGMFTSGVSALETTVYAIAALMSHPAVLALPFGPVEQRMCGPARLLDWLTPHTRAAMLCGSLTRLLASTEWSLWIDLRNRMTHRSDLPRIIHASIGAPPPVTNPLLFAATSSTPHVDADTADFDALHLWLAATIRELVIEAGNVANGT
jgi:hypothetical protein